MRNLVDRVPMPAVLTDATSFAPGGKANQKSTTPRAHTTLCEDFGYVAFLQEDPTCIFPFHATAFLSRLDEQWYISIQTANGQRKTFPLVCATGSEALAFCSWLNNLAEAVVLALPDTGSKRGV